MVDWISHRCGVRQLRRAGWGAVIVSGLWIVLCYADSFALPSASDTSEQAPIVSKGPLRGPYDRLAGGEEALARYANTGDRVALIEARETLSAVGGQFSSKTLKTGSVDISDVVAFARFSNLMFRYTGQEPFRRQAEESLRFMRDDHRPLSVEEMNSLQQAEEELLSSPLHITVVGGKDDLRAQQLWKEAVRVNEKYIRREWWDRREGALPNPDVRYPQLGAPAAFVCVDSKCSVPLFTVDELRERLAQRMVAN